MNTSDHRDNPFVMQPSPLPPRPPQPPDQSNTPPQNTPDPGSRTAALIAWIIFIVCTLTIAVQNQIEHFTPAPTTPITANQPPQQPPIAPPDVDPTSLTLRFALKYVQTDAAEARKAIAQIKGQAKPNPDSLLAVRFELAEAIIDSFTNPADLSATATRLTDQANQQTDERLKADLLLAAKVYTLPPTTTNAAATATAPGPELLNPDAVSAFRQRHGFLASATLGYADPLLADARTAATSGVELIVILFISIIVGFVATLLLGIVLLVLRITALNKPHQPSPSVLLPPLPGGSLPIEIAAVFVAGFLIMRAGITAAAHALSPDFANLLAILLPWSLTALVLFYPIIRGIRFAHARQILGLTAPRGIIREIFAGILGWITAFPLLVLALIVSFIALFIIQLLTNAPTESNARVLELAAGAKGWGLVLFLALLTVWAPLTEELVIRGGLYRQLRTRLPVILAVLISAFFFAILHQYPLFLMTPVFTLGCLFALLRQSRTSLIASITAHALNNALVGIILLVMLNLLLG